MKSEDAMIADGLAEAYKNGFEDGKKSMEPKRGRWIDLGNFEQCSVCMETRLKKFKSDNGEVTWFKTPYCAFCGAKMEGKTDEERND